MLPLNVCFQLTLLDIGSIFCFCKACAVWAKSLTCLELILLILICISLSVSMKFCYLERKKKKKEVVIEFFVVRQMALNLLA